MRKLKLPAVVIAAVLLFSLRPVRQGVAQQVDRLRILIGLQPDGSVLTPVNQMLRAAGEEITFAGRPTDLALSPDGTTLVGLSRTSYVVIDVASRKVRQNLTASGLLNSFAGLLFAADASRCYASRARGPIQLLDFRADAVSMGETITLPTTTLDPNRGAVPGGMAMSPDGRSLLVCLSRLNTLAVINLQRREPVRQIAVGNVPFAVAITRDGKRAFVTNWAGGQAKPGEPVGKSSGTDIAVDDRGIASRGSVSIVDLEQGQETAQLEVGLHPSALVLGPDDSRLYVSNSNSDTISVIDTQRAKVVRSFSVKPDRRLPFGSSPTGLAITRDGATLYAALGGNNCVEVIRLRGNRARLAGLIPTGWYPTALRLSPDDKTLYVANTKGRGSLDTTRRERGHNSHDHLGSVSIIAVPGDDQLRDLTRQVHRNNRWDEVLGTKPPASPAPAIKHVIYIIKENRTYDQVFGDMTQGKGDPALCQFGAAVTPNHHALASEFVLLDNFYCCGILSADGHQWCLESYVTDYLERSFGGFPRSYPYDGTDAMAYSSSGFLWDGALRLGKTFRNYGEFTIADGRPPRATWIDFYRDWKAGTRKLQVPARTQVKPLEKYLCPTYPGFANMIPDQVRCEEFLREFREFERNGNLPNLITMLLPDDHTAGTSPNYPTPRAQVADNDLALGRIVEAVSQSRFWKETAILVVEDDPQGGLDHLDGHRTVALCISPYTKRRIVDSTLYNQTSMVRTIELLLGLPPMNQFDLTATPMANCFTTTPDFTPYAARPNQIPLDEMNPPAARLTGLARTLAVGCLRSAELEEPDGGDQRLLTRAIWFSTHGTDLPQKYRHFHDEDGD